MNVINALEWRSSIKQFDPEKKVSQEDLEDLLNAANLAPTSGGFQALKVVVVEEGELKSKLANHAYGQPQVKDASHVLIFAADANLTEDTVDQYVKRAVEVRGITEESMAGYAQSMKTYIGSMSAEQRAIWTRCQAYIALGTVIAAAAEKQIDTCPMEGFEAAEYQKILGLESENLMPAVILPIGYRSEEDVYSKLPKVRKKREDFILELK